MVLSRFLPFVAVALLSVWAVSSTQPRLSAAGQPGAARLDASARPRPPAPIPAVAVPTRAAAVLIDVRSGNRLEVDAVRDNRGDAWLARDGSALWTHTTQGLVLVALDGHVLERIPGATDLHETADGAVRAYRINDDWLVTTPRGTRRLLGPLGFPSLSPDGRYFAFELLGGRFREIHALELRSGEEIEVAHSLGLCHCSTAEGYGFPEWTRATVLTFRDAGDFNAPPEEHEQGARFEYDLAARLMTRVSEAPPRDSNATPCDATATLRSADGSTTLEYRRVCTLPQP
jgi:hypothetical protein